MHKSDSKQSQEWDYLGWRVLYLYGQLVHTVKCFAKLFFFFSNLRFHEQGVKHVSLPQTQQCSLLHPNLEIKTWYDSEAIWIVNYFAALLASIGLGPKCQVHTNLLRENGIEINSWLVNVTDLQCDCIPRWEVSQTFWEWENTELDFSFKIEFTMRKVSEFMSNSKQRPREPEYRAFYKREKNHLPYFTSRIHVRCFFKLDPFSFWN